MTEYTNLKEAIQTAITEHKTTSSIQLITDFEGKFYVSTIKSLHENVHFSLKPINVVGIVGYGKIFTQLKDL